MNMQLHEQLKGHIWDIANRLRGPYRPPQYRFVMLPMVVLRRLDCVLSPTKDRVLREYERLQAMGVTERAMDRMLGKAADPERNCPLYNTSPFTFRKLRDDSENISPNLVAYINGFCPTARSIFERFKFDAQIRRLRSDLTKLRITHFTMAIMTNSDAERFGIVRFAVACTKTTYLP